MIEVQFLGYILISRRVFLGFSFLSLGVLLFKDKKLFGATSVIKTIKQVQSDLFPPVAGIDTQKLDSISYLKNIVLKHSRISQEEKSFIRNGAKWLNEESIKTYNKLYISLDKPQREKILKKVSKTSWGESWLYTMMSYLFEALLSDPIYGVNKDEIAWRWLGFEGGVPRPKKAFL